MEGITPPTTVALFIDAENLIIPIQMVPTLTVNLQAIVLRVREEGTLIVSRAYGDWSKWPCRDYVQEFAGFGVEMYQVFSDSKTKNTADIMIAADVMEYCLNPISSDSIVLVSGDRDFVPLVQRLRRHGKKVICISVEEAASVTLKNTIDTYIGYSSLLKDAAKVYAGPKKEKELPPVAAVTKAVAIEPEEEESDDGHRDERYHAFMILLQAVKAIRRRGSLPMNKDIPLMMRQLWPEFDFQLLGYETVTDFVRDAENKKFVNIIHYSEESGNFSVEISSQAVYEAEDYSYAIGGGYSFDSVEEACESYINILKEKKVPWVSWEYRGAIVEHLWTTLENSSAGKPLTQMKDMLNAYVKNKGWPIDEGAIWKILFNLNIGGCFKHDSPNEAGDRIQDWDHTHAQTAVSLDAAFDRMHRAYLVGIRDTYPDTQFIPEAVAQLFYEKTDSSAIKDAYDLIKKANVNNR